MKLFQERRIQFLLICVLMVGIVIGIFIPIIVSSDNSKGIFGDRWVLVGDPLSKAEFDIPLSSANAATFGWIDPFLCSPGRGRYFSNQDFPNLFLLYNTSENLFGIYLNSDLEMPFPWKKMPNLTKPGGKQIVNKQHWGLYTLINDPLQACKSPDSRSVGTGPSASTMAGSAVRNYAPQSTATPSSGPAQALKDLLDVISTDSRIFVISKESDKTIVLESITSSQLHKTLSGINDVQDSSSKWINNISHRGLTGNLEHTYLKNILKSSEGNNLKISVWINKDKQVVFIEITGSIKYGNEQFSKLNILSE